MIFRKIYLRFFSPSFTIYKTGFTFYSNLLLNEEKISQLTLLTTTSIHQQIDRPFKQISISSQEQELLKSHPVVNKTSQKLLKVAIIGSPNAGKSTIANKLIGCKFAPVSNKVHTTRNNTIGVLTEGDNQIIFLDTPGVVDENKVKKHNLERSLLMDPHLALNNADMILVIVDVSKLWNRNRLDYEISKIISYHQDKKILLILNKVDLLKSKDELLNVVRILTEGYLNGEQFYQPPSKKIQSMNKNDLCEKLFQKMKNIQLNDSMSSEVIVNGLNINNEKNSDNLATVNKDSANLENLSLQVDNEKFLIPNVVSSHVSEAQNSHLTLSAKKNWDQYYRQLKTIGNKLKDRNGWPHFEAVFMLSAITGDGIFDLKKYLLNSTISSNWLYDPTLITDQDPKKIAKMVVWERLLDNLSEEIPYEIDIKLVLWDVCDEEDGLLRVQVELICPRKRHMKNLLGKDGSNIQLISRQVKQELMNIFKREMSLQLVIRKGFADSK